MNSKVTASIEARMSSSRLPGKVLMDVAGKPALTRLLERLRACTRLDDIVLATTTNPTDDALADWATQNAVACYRGSEEDVLARVVDAHRSVGSDIVVEVTGDCTLLDPGVIDMGVETFLANRCDVVSNVGKMLTYPMGVDVQVFRLDALAEVAATVDDPAVREHVSLYFYENPNRYHIFYLTAPPRWRAPQLRFQLDYAQDLEFLNAVYTRLEPQHGPMFGVEEVMALLRAEPDLAAINRDCEEKQVR